MAITRVNSASISNASAAASAYTAAVGVAVAVGDLIVVNMASNGTHATNGMACTVANNGAATTLLEVQGGNASSKWQQTFYKFTTATMATTDTISCTPYAANTASSFSVDIFRGTAGTINRAVVGSSGASATTAASPALASAPTAGSLVLSLVQASGTGTEAVAAPYTKGSATVTTTGTSNAYVLSADGTSTYGVTWTWGAAMSSSLQTVAFDAAGAAPAIPPIIVMPPRR